MKHPNTKLIQAGCGAIGIAMLTAFPALAQTDTPAETSTPEVSMSASASEAKTENKRHFVFGVNAGLYIPTDSKTRDRFGSSGFSIGPGFGTVRRVHDKGVTSLAFSFISMEKGGNKFYMLPIGLQYIRPLNRRKDTNIHPYYGLSLDAVPAKIDSETDGVDTGIKLGYGGSAFIGTTLGRNAFVQGRYRLISDIESFNLSGFDMSVGYRF